MDEGRAAAAHSGRGGKKVREYSEATVSADALAIGETAFAFYCYYYLPIGPAHGCSTIPYSR